MVWFKLLFVQIYWEVTDSALSAFWWNLIENIIYIIYLWKKLLKWIIFKTFSIKSPPPPSFLFTIASVQSNSNVTIKRPFGIWPLIFKESRPRSFDEKVPLHYVTATAIPLFSLCFQYPLSWFGQLSLYFLVTQPCFLLTSELGINVNPLAGCCILSNKPTRILLITPAQTPLSKLLDSLTGGIVRNLPPQPAILSPRLSLHPFPRQLNAVKVRRSCCLISLSTGHAAARILALYRPLHLNSFTLQCSC